MSVCCDGMCQMLCVAVHKCGVRVFVMVCMIVGKGDNVRVCVCVMVCDGVCDGVCV